MVRFLYSHLPAIKEWKYWVLARALMKVWNDLFVDQSQLSYQVTNLLMGFFDAWIFGPIWSEFVLVSYLAMALYSIIFFVMIKQIDGLKTVSKILAWLLFGLALFMVWLEPFLTISGWATIALITMFPPLGAPLIAIDIVVSVAHYLMTCKIIDAIENGE